MHTTKPNSNYLNTTGAGGDPHLIRNSSLSPAMSEVCALAPSLDRL